MSVFAYLGVNTFTTLWKDLSILPKTFRAELAVGVLSPLVLSGVSFCIDSQVVSFFTGIGELSLKDGLLILFIGLRILECLGSMKPGTGLDVCKGVAIFVGFVTLSGSAAVDILVNKVVVY